MKKTILLTTILLLSTNLVFAANLWRDGTGADTLLGSTVVSDIDTKIYQNMTEPIDRVLANYRENAEVTYTSVSSVTIAIGEVMCSNSAGTIRRMRKNPATTVLTWANIDTGVEANDTYYVYAVCDADADTFTGVISLNSTTPSGVTYFKRLSTFLNSSGDIQNDSAFTNDNDYYAAAASSANESIVAVGTTPHGSTISLPSGWSNSDCHATVGAGTLADLSGAGAIDYMTVSVSSRVVTCTYHQTNWVDSGTSTNGTCTANHMISCYR